MSVEVCEVGKLACEKHLSWWVLQENAGHASANNVRCLVPAAVQRFHSVYAHHPVRCSLPNVAAFEMNSGRCSVKSLINLLVLPDWDEGGRNLLRASWGSERGCGCGGATTAVTAWGTSGWAPTSKEMLLPRGSKQKMADLLPPCLGINEDFQWKYFPF